MVSGTKPLAMFYAYVSELPDERLIPEESFSPHVKAGRFVRNEIVIEGLDHLPPSEKNTPIKYVFFATTQEAWRIPAMILLKRSFRNSSYKWNETLERMESALLGYTDEEIDAWCKSRFTSAQK